MSSAAPTVLSIAVLRDLIPLVIISRPSAVPRFTIKDRDVRVLLLRVGVLNCIPDGNMEIEVENVILEVYLIY